MLHGLLLAQRGGPARIPASSLRFPYRSLLTLAIETSCDDTCVAILEKDRKNGNMRSSPSTGPRAKLLFNEKITADSTAHQGIHPIQTLDSHRANLAHLISRSLRSLPPPDENRKKPNTRIYIGETGAPKLKPDFISVTRGPGMRSNLSCGLDTAKGLAVAWGVPLVAVHHMQAHALTPRLACALEELTKPTVSGTREQGEQSGAYEERLKREGRIQRVYDSNKLPIEPNFPFLSLLVSGGHTLLVHSTGLTEHTILATTADIAVGDALDKMGRLILPKEVLEHLNSSKDTAFAKHLSQYAFSQPEDFTQYPVPFTREQEIRKRSNEYGWHLQTPFAETKELTFSFSGIASRMEALWAKRSRGLDFTEDERRLFARTAVGTSFEHLASRTVIAIEKMRNTGENLSTLVVSGGVASNDFLRVYLRRFLDIRGLQSVKLEFPPSQLCTDNAAMIAWTAMEMFEAGFRSDLGCEPLKKWSMDSESEDGGVAGVAGWASTCNRSALDD